jgi:hypothetical protein
VVRTQIRRIAWRTLGRTGLGNQPAVFFERLRPGELLDVIYSLPDDAETAAVAEMFRVLKPGGHLLLNVAALEMLKGDHSVLSGEIRRYSTRQLRSVLERGGFEIVRLTYTNATILPLVAATRLLQRVRGHEESAQEISVPPAPVNAALTGLLAVESMALRFTNMPLGTSALALARKP